MTITDLPPLLFSDDWARTRATDPSTSHAAADQSQGGLSPLRLAVLRLIRNNPGVIGSEINDLFHLAVARGLISKGAAWDSPRKRAGELAPLYVDVTGERVGHSNTPEREFTINDRGLAALKG